MLGNPGSKGSNVHVEVETFKIFPTIKFHKRGKEAVVIAQKFKNISNYYKQQLWHILMFTLKLSGKGERNSYKES